MKTFETPTIEVIRLSTEDILTTSGNDLPLSPLTLEDDLGITKIN